MLRRLQGAGGTLPQPRYLGNSGRLFFDSQDSLSAFDTNEGVEDVYQFEPEGVGGCGREGGCVGLISAGSEAVDSNFLAADESGKNVFFTTRDRLVGADTDELIDLYDAREGGGFPPPVSEPPPGEAPARRSRPSNRPRPRRPSPTPATSNPQPHCRKGQGPAQGQVREEAQGQEGQARQRGER